VWEVGPVTTPPTRLAGQVLAPRVAKVLIEKE
jgi:hypothetical protein